MDGTVLSCDAEGFEPLDLAADRAALASGLTLEMRPARAVRLETDWSGAPGIVEWRVLGAEGTVLLARRRLAVPARMTLLVADEPRWLRFRAEGRSPASVFVPAGIPGPTLRVPRPGPGGEILGLVPPHAIVPEAVAVTAAGVRLTAKVDPARSFTLRGLAPGRYDLAPRYRGGVAGRTQSVLVRSGQTSELVPLPLVEPGAVAFAAGPEVCGTDQLPLRLWVRRLGGEGAGEPSRALVASQTIEAPPCDRELEGLEPGEYEAGLVSAIPSPEVGAQELSTARFQVRRGQRSEVTLAPSVFVEGRLTVGDRPPAGITLQFQLDTRAWIAAPNEDGDYAVRLGAPGEYTISVRAADGVPSAWFSRRLERGSQREDFALSAGAISVRVHGQDGDPPAGVVSLAVTRSDGLRITGEPAPGREEAVRFAGLDFGEYAVTASTPTGLSSQEATAVTLSAEAPVAEVELTLGRHQGWLTVVDENGMLVESAQVRAGTTALVAAEPGTYRLGTVAMGERLTLSAEGYVPVCHLLQAADLPSLRQVLTRASETVTVHFASGLSWEAARLSGLPGSDCPVDLPDAGPAPRYEPQRTSVAIPLPAGSFQLVLGPASYPLVAPGRDVQVP